LIYTRRKYYYSPKLGLGCNLGKDLSKRGENNQLVKHKDTGLYLQLYIPSDHEEREKHSLSKRWMEDGVEFASSRYLGLVITREGSDKVWELIQEIGVEIHKVG